MRRSAAIASVATGGDDSAHTPQGREGDKSNGSIAVAVATFQDCLICARRAVLAVTARILRVSWGACFSSTTTAALYCTVLHCTALYCTSVFWP